jgi:hypothetical protein
MKGHELIIKGAILLSDWAFKYVVITNLGRRGFKAILEILFPAYEMKPYKPKAL